MNHVIGTKEAQAKVLPKFSMLDDQGPRKQKRPPYLCVTFFLHCQMNAPLLSDEIIYFG